MSIIKEYNGADASMKNPLAGLTGDKRYSEITNLVSRWSRRNQDQVLLYNEYADELRSELKDKQYGDISGKKFGSGTRIGIIVHPGLLSYIQAFFPNFLDNIDDLHWFKKNYPNWRIPRA
jgi:hypothetical protein